MNSKMHLLELLDRNRYDQTLLLKIMIHPLYNQILYRLNPILLQLNNLLRLPLFLWRDDLIRKLLPTSLFLKKISFFVKEELLLLRRLEHLFLMPRQKFHRLLRRCGIIRFYVKLLELVFLFSWNFLHILLILMLDLLFLIAILKTFYL